MNINLKNKKTVVLIGTVAALALVLVGVTLAMLNQRSQQATNAFAAAVVNVGVVEKNGGTDKTYEDSIDNANTNTYTTMSGEAGSPTRTVTKEVAIKNIHSTEYPTTDTWVRVRLVPCLRYTEDNDERHETAGQLVPVNMADKVSYSELGDKWEQLGDYYYYTEALKPNALTTKLIQSVTYNGELPENTHFELQVLTEGVSAKQPGAAQDAWGINIPDAMKTTTAGA